MVKGWARDRVVIDNGLVLVHKVPELPGFHQGTYPRCLNCQVFTIGCLYFLYYFSLIYKDTLRTLVIEFLEMNNVSGIIQEFSFWCT